MPHVFLPHVNYGTQFRVRYIEGSPVIQLGLLAIKGIGPKAAIIIQNELKKHGAFKSQDDFEERCKDRAINIRVIKALKENGALNFNKKSYESRVLQYNSQLYCRNK